MKCHLCGEELTCDNINIWKLEDRRMVGYGCRNRMCRPPSSVSTDSSVFMHVVIPDGEITYYLLRFPHRDKWYQIASLLFQDGGETIFSVVDADVSKTYVYNRLVTLPRFIPLDWHKSLEEQANVLLDKLKTLLLFL